MGPKYLRGGLRMPKDTELLEAVEKAGEERTRAAARLEESREELRQAVNAAKLAGVSGKEIARAAGVSRQALYLDSSLPTRNNR